MIVFKMDKGFEAVFVSGPRFSPLLFPLPWGQSEQPEPWGHPAAQKGCPAGFRTASGAFSTKLEVSHPKPLTDFPPSDPIFQNILCYACLQVSAPPGTVSPLRVSESLAPASDYIIWPTNHLSGILMMSSGTNQLPCIPQGRGQVLFQPETVWCESEPGGGEAGGSQRPWGPCM